MDKTSLIKTVPRMPLQAYSTESNYQYTEVAMDKTFIYDGFGYAYIE